MAIYLETNALRKLTDYNCNQPVVTSIFSIFELLSGVKDQNDYHIRRQCLQRVNKQNMEIRIPMIDKLLGVPDYNKYAAEMIMDIYGYVLKTEAFSNFQLVKLKVGRNDGSIDYISANDWLKNWDEKITEITKKSGSLFSDEDKSAIRKIYNDEKEAGLAKHFIEQIFNPGIIGDSSYAYKLFMTAQYVVFTLAWLNGNTQNKNNASDLLHLLYIEQDDKFISNDKIYQTIKNACSSFSFIPLDNQKKLSELIQ